MGVGVAKAYKVRDWWHERVVVVVVVVSGEGVVREWFGVGVAVVDTEERERRWQRLNRARLHRDGDWYSHGYGNRGGK